MFRHTSWLGSKDRLCAGCEVQTRTTNETRNETRTLHSRQVHSTTNWMISWTHKLIGIEFGGTQGISISDNTNKAKLNKCNIAKLKYMLNKEVERSNQLGRNSLPTALMRGQSVLAIRLLWFNTAQLHCPHDHNPCELYHAFQLWSLTARAGRLRSSSLGVFHLQLLKV